MISDRMVLREQEREEDVRCFARGLDMTIIRDVSSPEQQAVVREITWEAHSGVKLHYAADRLSASRIISVEGGDNEHFRKFIDVVIGLLDPLTLDELIDEVDSHSDGDPRSLALAVIRLGVGATNEYSDDVFYRIRDAMRSPESWVRNAAIWATMYSRWPQFFPLLEEVADTDPDETTRNEARQMVDFDYESGSEP